jgi:hypothetical protein
MLWRVHDKKVLKATLRPPFSMAPTVLLLFPATALTIPVFLPTTSTLVGLMVGLFPLSSGFSDALLHNTKGKRYSMAI